MIGLLGTLIVPLFVYAKAVISSLVNPGHAISVFSLYDDALMFLMLLFAPMVLTILGAWIISREYTDQTLKNIYAIPVSRTAFLCGKLLFFAMLALMFMLISWLEILLSALLCSCFLPVAELTAASFLYFLVKMLLGGGLLCVTQMPLLYLAIRTKEFVAPLIAIAAISLVTVVLSNSPIAGFYPWSASYFLVMGHLPQTGCPRELSLFIILVTGSLGIAACFVHFHRAEVR